jgi:predicted solute-binding protein
MGGTYFPFAMTQFKVLGVLSQLYCRPLVWHLEHRQRFSMKTGTPAENAIRLRRHELAAALMTPLDYAREMSHSQMFPAAGVSSEGRGDVVTLHFREGLHTISTLAADPSSSAEIVLAKIILGEQFESDPSIVPVVGTLSGMLEKADAALVVGRENVQGAAEHANMIDLVDAWTDMTRLPYVHAIWCGRMDDIAPQDIEEITPKREAVASSIDEIASQSAPELARSVRDYLETFTFGITDDVEIAMTEFLRYAYYHGFIPDIPDLRFFGRDPDEQLPPPPSVSPN